jgi:hypothetical protein
MSIETFWTIYVIGAIVTLFILWLMWVNEDDPWDTTGWPGISFATLLWPLTLIGYLLVGAWRLFKYSLEHWLPAKPGRKPRLFCVSIRKGKFSSPVF